MFRVVACLALMLSAVLVPLEQPGARAEQWMTVRNADFCVDIDSIRRGDDGEVMWLAKPTCGDSDSLRMKTNCWHRNCPTRGD